MFQVLSEMNLWNHCQSECSPSFAWLLSFAVFMYVHRTWKDVVSCKTWKVKKVGHVSCSIWFHCFANPCSYLIILSLSCGVPRNHSCRPNLSFPWTFLLQRFWNFEQNPFIHNRRQSSHQKAEILNKFKFLIKSIPKFGLLRLFLAAFTICLQIS